MTQCLADCREEGSMRNDEYVGDFYAEIQFLNTHLADTIN